MQHDVGSLEVAAHPLDERLRRRCSEPLVGIGVSVLSVSARPGSANDPLRLFRLGMRIAHIASYEVLRRKSLGKNDHLLAARKRSENARQRAEGVDVAIDALAGQAFVHESCAVRHIHLKLLCQAFFARCLR